MAGLSLPALLRAVPAADGSGPAGAGAEERDPALDGGRARARSTRGTPSPTVRSRIAARSASFRPGCRVSLLRAPAHAGGDARQVHAHPLGRLPRTATTSRTRCFRPPTSRPSRGSTATAETYPAIGSIVAKMHGPNHPTMPPTSRS